jgi:hypothetical protein
LGREEGPWNPDENEDEDEEDGGGIMTIELRIF